MKSLIALTHRLSVGILASQCEFSSIVNTSQVLALGSSAEMRDAIRRRREDGDLE